MSDGRRESGSAIRAVLEVIGLTFVALVISLVAGVVFVVPLVVLGYDVQTTLGLAGVAAAGQVGFLLVAYGFVKYRNVAVPIRVPSRSEWGYVVVGTVAALIAASALSALLQVLGLVPDAVIGDIVTTDPTFLLALAALSVVIIAPAEELLFRGAIQGRLGERFGPLGAIVGSSLLFGSIHLANFAGALLPVVAGALLIATVGSILGILYERTKNLAVPILVHAIYNVALMVSGYLAVT